MKKNLFFLAAATIALASCSNEEVIESSRHNGVIDFRASIAQGATSRGVETDQATLSEFYVTAIYGKTTWFHDQTFAKLGNDNIYESTGEEFYWPGHGSLDFYTWGYNAGKSGAMPAALDTEKIGNATVTPDNQSIIFTVADTVPEQIDLVAAVQTASKADVRENGIGLTFEHALCEIEIRAMSNNPNYDFEVGGYAICGVKKTGTYSFKGDTIKDAVTGEVIEIKHWTDLNNVADYMMNFTDNPKKLLHDQIVEISQEAGGSDDTNPNFNKTRFVMPIPQQLTPWDHVKDKDNLNNGALMALLVKITNPDVLDEKGQPIRTYPRRSNDPENPFGVGSSRDNPDYGWACVPISADWKPGMRYIYTLDFTYGAGQFPPKDNDQPGEDILGGPIKFNVTVVPWTEASSSINMNGHDETTEVSAASVEAE